LTISGKKILEKESIDTNSNFFDVGGDSLLVVKIITEIKSIFDVDISVVDFYDCTTISSMSEFVLKNIKQINSDNQINGPVVKIPADDVLNKLKNDKSKSDEKKETSRNKMKNLARQRMDD
jgi:acyl carrier protein